MKKLLLLLFTIFVSATQVSFTNAQESPIDLPLVFEPLTTFKHFNQIADSGSDKFVFRLLQFTAPFGGGYNETCLTKTGRAYSHRVTTRAIQGSGRAELDKSQVEKINQIMSDFASKNIAEKLNPIGGKRYSTLILNNGQKTFRYDFVGQIPDEIKSTVEFFSVEFEKADKLETQRFAEEDRILKEKYGDWQNKAGLLRPTEVGSQALKNDNTVLLYLKGSRQPIKDDSSTKIPIYYVLVSYPEAGIIGGAGGSQSNSPISSSGITWALPRGINKEVRKNLVITYNAVDETLEINKKLYKLTDGNLFIIKMNAEWQSDVNQFKVYLSKPIDIQNVILEFQRESNDLTLQLQDLNVN